MPIKIVPVMIKDDTGDAEPHPCDPPEPCEPCDSKCFGPTICYEKLKNPQKPFDTKCKNAPYLAVEKCDEDKGHLCDPVVCVPGKRPSRPCDPAILLSRIKNPEEQSDIVCEHVLYSEIICDNIEVLRQKVKEPDPKLRYTMIKINPFEDEKRIQELQEEFKIQADEKWKKYQESFPTKWPGAASRPICTNLKTLKQKVLDCFSIPNYKIETYDPFKYEKMMKEIQEEMREEEVDPCLEYKLKRRFFGAKKKKEK